MFQNVLITINTKETSMLGISPCMYAGDYDKYSYFCPSEPMSLNLIPNECTSFVYEAISYHDGLIFNPLYENYITVSNLAQSKPLFIYFGYQSPKAWLETFTCTDFTADAENMKIFLQQIKVKGLILKNLNYDYNDHLDFHFECTFYDKLKSYISTMKNINPDLEIGLQVNANNMIYYKNYPTSPDWFNFVVLNDVVQYYIINFDKFNPCNELFKGGIVPMNNVKQYTHSLKSFASALNASTIAKDKIYLEFVGNPIINDTTTEDLPTCCITYQKYCEADHYNTFWCADTSDSFYEKGKFAKEIQAQGFVTKYIDAIDPSGKCDCDNKNKFITFSMMRRGFLGIDPITDCIKLNKCNSIK